MSEHRTCCLCGTSSPGEMVGYDNPDVWAHRDCQGSNKAEIERLRLEVERKDTEIEDLKQSLAVEQEPFALERAEARQENAKLRERVAELLKAATLFRLYGLPPQDVSGSAEWNTAVELLTKEGGDDER